MEYMDGSEKLAHVSQDGMRRQTVLEHLYGTANLAAGFAEPFGAAGQAYLAGLLHDIGKYSNDFQKRLAGGSITDHSTAGAKEAFSMKQPEVAFAVAGHHGGLPDGGAKTDTEGPTLFARIKKKDLPAYDEWKQEVKLPDRTERKCFRDPFSTAFYTRMLYSCLVDADYLDTETFMNGAPALRGGGQPPEQLLARLREYVDPWWNAKNELNQKRCEILRTCFEKGRTEQPGLFTLTVPTGGGKTVSSLAFALSHAVAHGKRRIVYVIPYTSIIDQTAEVFADILGEENVLEHHSGSDAVMDETKSEPGTYGKVLATENWDAPVIVTTAVQFFESLFANRSSRCRKLHNLADSVIVFDEAQTLPLAYLRPCVAAIGQLVRYYGASAVLCTATQPALGSLFRELAPELTLREICTDTAALYRFFRRTNLRNAGELTEPQLAEQLGQAQQVLCVVNRRATAQRLYSSLPSDGSYCLTTLLCAADRKRLLRAIRSRLQAGLTCRVVSTSLIEAGVDVDFPAAWREEAGLDSVLQTAGRCNREGKYPAEDSLVTVFRLSGQPVPQIIRPNADAAHSVWRDFEDPSQPQAIQAYFSLLYAVKGEDALDQKQILKGFNGTMEGRILPFATAAERFHLIQSCAVTVYIPKEENRELIAALRQSEGNRSVYRKLGQYGVTVYPDHLAALHAAGAVEAVDEDGWVLTDETLYSQETGLSLDVEAGEAWMIYRHESYEIVTKEERRMIQLEVWGDYALFSRPELKVERMSYDAPTPSAARGLVEAIYYHPGLQWHIDRIYLLNPIHFVNIRRNEVKSKVLATSVRAAAQGNGPPLYLATSQEIVQRASLLLQDVHYVIEAHFTMTDRAAPGDNPGKFQDIVTRRMERGQCYHTPYFGCREFPAKFRRWSGGRIPAIQETRDLGLMLYDFDYSDPKNITPTYFLARLEKGVIHVADCEVLR